MVQLNTNIPMMGVVPDFANVLAQSSQAAGVTNDLRRQNALAQLYQAQGPGIAAGDQGAMNALAQFDPAAALGVQDTRQGMDARALAMDATRQNMEMQTREWAMRLDDRERAQRLAEGQQMLSGMIAASASPQAWDAWATQTGQTQFVGQYGQRESFIANMLPPLQALEYVQTQGAARQERKDDSKAPLEFQADRYRNVEGVGLVDLNPGGGAAPQPVQFSGQPQQPEQDFGAVMDLRKEINANPVVRSFIDISTAYNRIQSSYQVAQAATEAGAQPPAAGDIALIFGFMKMLDPTSVVREGEFATAQNTGGVSESIINLYNQAMDGQRLTPEQRADFLRQAQAIYNGQRDQFKSVVNDYSGIAQRYGVNLEDVVVGYGSDQMALPPAPTAPPPQPAPSPQLNVLPPPGPQPPVSAQPGMTTMGSNPLLPSNEQTGPLSAYPGVRLAPQQVPLPPPQQVLTWGEPELTQFLMQNGNRPLPPEVWGAIVARSAQLDQGAMQ